MRPRLPVDRKSAARRHRIPALLAVVAAAPAAAAEPAANAPVCWPSCTSKSPCVPPVEGPKACAAIQEPSAGTLQLLYRYKNAPWYVLADQQHSVREQLRKYPPDPCSLGDAACLQRQQDQRSGASGGHGADGRSGQPGGRGRPCELWLPCGDVMVPQGAWTLRLKDGAFAGTWRVSVVRSPTGEAWSNRDLPVAGGRVAVPAGLFKPATLYAYRLLQAPGNDIASGEFQSVGSAAASAVRQAAEQAAGQGQRDAWLGTLTENELDWNVLQLLASGGGETP
jgi:hypothetical protein